MKKMILALPVLLGLAACNKNVSDEIKIHPVNTYSETTKVSFSIKSDAAKDGLSGANWDYIHEVNFLVYEPGGSLYDMDRAYAPDFSASLTVPAGVAGFKVVALVNPADESYMELHDYSLFLQKAGNLSDECSSYDQICCKMIGILSDVTFQEGAEYEMTVNRLVSRIDLLKLIYQPDGAYCNTSFSIEKIFLINVNTAYDFEGGPGKWNKYEWANKKEDEICQPLDYYTLQEFDAVIADGESYDDGCTFVCCPNMTVEDSHSATWCPRHTRLVVKGTILDIDEQAIGTYYYPVDLQAGGNHCLDPNTLYKIKSLTITGPGNSSEDMQLVSASFSLEVEIGDWAEGTSQEVTL